MVGGWEDSRGVGSTEMVCLKWLKREEMCRRCEVHKSARCGSEVMGDLKNSQGPHQQTVVRRTSKQSSTLAPLLPTQAKQWREGHVTQPPDMCLYLDGSDCSQYINHPQSTMCFGPIQHM